MIKTIVASLYLKLPSARIDGRHSSYFALSCGRTTAGRQYQRIPKGRRLNLFFNIINPAARRRFAPARPGQKARPAAAGRGAAGLFSLFSPSERRCTP